MRDDNSATVVNGVAVLRPPATPPAELAWQGTALAFVGVFAFSGSFPSTVLAMRGFDPYLVAFGRAAIAVVVAAVWLLAARVPLVPPRSQWRSYGLIALGVVFGFPLFSGVALDLGASTSHAAVVIGLLPAATAAAAVLLAGERPRAGFWIAVGAGALAVTAFTLSRGGGHVTLPDVLLAGALVSAAVGYAEGAKLTRDRPGWQVVSHVLVLAAVTEVSPSPASVAGFAYAGLVSMFFGFIPWYAGLARGGIARAGQTQLVQPLLTLVWAWLLIGERFGLVTVVGAAAVLVCVTLTQRFR